MAESLPASVTLTKPQSPPCCGTPLNSSPTPAADPAPRLPKRRSADVWRQTAGVVVGDRGPRYRLQQPASSFERQGQKIRRASQILEGKLATCLDLAVLFARGWKRSASIPCSC
jgi:hypothetical protein